MTHVSAEQQAYGDVDRLGDVFGLGAAGDPAHERGEPHVADDADDRGVLVGRFAVLVGAVDRAGDHRGQLHADEVDLVGDRGVGEHERAGECLGQLGLLLQSRGGVAEDVHDALVRGVAGNLAVARLLLGPLELATERGDQEMDLGREVAVERAERDISVVGDGSHLDGVKPARVGKGDRGIENAAAAFTLGVGAGSCLRHAGHAASSPVHGCC